MTTYTAADAYSDAYGDALNEFTDRIKVLIPALIATNCAGQWRDDVEKLIEEDDALVADFLREALARLDRERQKRPSAPPLVGAAS